jgi:hypothetical protein
MNLASMKAWLANSKLSVPETCKEEGIACEVEVDYNDNAHCIDLISSLVSYFFKIID